jgi:hypothetical protein
MTNTNRYVTRNNSFDDNQDFYPTPEKCVLQLLEREIFNNNISEPACWDWAISKVLESKWYKVYSTDLIDRWYWKWWIDFLKTAFQDNKYDIITNPPYKLAKQFLLESLRMSKNKVAFFMRLSFLESKERYEIFKKYPPAKVYVLSYRPEIFKNWIKTKNTWMVAYCWIVWDKQYKWPTILDWIL